VELDHPLFIISKKLIQDKVLNNIKKNGSYKYSSQASHCPRLDSLSYHIINKDDMSFLGYLFGFGHLKVVLISSNAA